MEKKVMKTRHLFAYPSKLHQFREYRNDVASEGDSMVKGLLGLTQKHS